MQRGPRRIVCLTEETVELLYLLGEQNRICGISVYAVRPPEAAREKPRITSFIKGDVEKIVGLKPDLVIGFSDIQSKLAADLIAAGLEVWVTNQRSIEEIFETMMRLGMLIHRSDSVRSLIDEWQARLDSASKNKSGCRADGTQKRVFFQEWDDPLIGGIQWVRELIEITGAIDFYSNATGESSLAKDRIVSVKDVAGFNPDAIIGSWCGKPVNYEWIQSQNEWSSTNALKNKQLFEIDSSVILQPGPALFLEGMDRLEDCLKRTE